MLKRFPIFPLLLSLLFCSFIIPQNFNIEGTYQLVVRKLADGTRIKSPDIIGLMTFSKGNRNFNVFYKDKDGKYFSYSVVSTYKLTDSEYSETKLSSVLNDEISGQKINYSMKEETATVPVERTGEKFQIKMPFDPVTVIFDGNRFIATSVDNSFTDYWEKVE